MHICTLSPLKILFPPMAFTLKNVQMTFSAFIPYCLKFHWYSVSKDPVPFHGFYSETCSDDFLSFHTSLFEIPLAPHIQYTQN